jgi:hypothetical protein
VQIDRFGERLSNQQLLQLLMVSIHQINLSGKIESIHRYSFASGHL